MGGQANLDHVDSCTTLFTSIFLTDERHRRLAVRIKPARRALRLLNLNAVLTSATVQLLIEVMPIVRFFNIPVGIRKSLGELAHADIIPHI